MSSPSGLGDISSLQCYRVLCNIAKVLRKMKLKKNGIPIFDVLFIRDRIIIPEGVNVFIQ